MKQSTHEKMAGAALACSFLHLAFCAHNYITSEIFRELALLILMVWFIIIWLNAKNLWGFGSSFLLLFWMAQLLCSDRVVRYINFSEQEADFEQLSRLILQNDTYQELSIYQNKTYKFVYHPPAESSLEQEQNFSIPVLLFQNFEEDSSVVYQLRNLIKKTQIESFQLGQGYLLFHFKKSPVFDYYADRQKPPLRYYFDPQTPSFCGDHRIKQQWYWVEKEV